MAHRFDRPVALLTAQASVSIEVGEPPDEALAAFHVRKLVDNELQRKRIDADVFAYASHLRYPLSVVQKKVLLAVDCLQQRLPASDFAERNDAAEPAFIAIADIGGNDALIVLRPPEDLGVEPVMIGIDEKYRGPRLRRAESAAAPGAGPYRRSNGWAGAVPAPRDASRFGILYFVGDIPKRRATGSKVAHGRSRSSATRQSQEGFEWLTLPSPFTQDDGGRRGPRHRFKQAPLLVFFLRFLDA